jgi:hypothetical protein
MYCGENSECLFFRRGLCKARGEANRPTADLGVWPNDPTADPRM